MKDNDIDNLLKEKANQIDDNKYNFKINVEEIKRKADYKRKIKVIKISFASALCACLILSALFFISKNPRPIDENVVLQGNDDEKINTEEILKSENIEGIVVNNKQPNYIGDEIPTNILIIKVTSVNNNKMFSNPETIVGASVIESLKGESNGDVTLTLDSSVVDSNSLPYDIIEKYNLKQNSLARVVLDERMINSSYPEVNKMYIVTTNREYKIINRCIYPFYEYNPDTKKVKIGDEWQDIDLNNIVW